MQFRFLYNDEMSNRNRKRTHQPKEIYHYVHYKVSKEQQIIITQATIRKHMHSEGTA